MAAKHNRHKVTVEDLAQVRALQGVGLTAVQALAFVPMSLKSVRLYMDILNAVHAGEAITCNPQYYSTKVVEAYCRTHGLQYRAAYVPAEATVEVQQEIPEAAPSARECLDGMLRAFLDLTLAAEELANKMRGLQIDAQHYAG